ncbi:hypothetical protein [Persephonella sp.]
MSRLEGFFSLSKDINKAKELEQNQGVIGELTDELNLDIKDEDLVQISKQYIRTWQPYETKIRKRQERIERYWLGKHDEEVLDSEYPSADNIIFEAVETFLPQATRQRPEPLVTSDNSEEGNALSKKIRNAIVFVSDKIRLKLKMKRVVRYWSLYLLGAGKIVWNLQDNEIDFETIRPQKLILDPSATVEEGGIYTGEYIGEYKREVASDLIKKFPEKEDYIKNKVKGKLGTKVQYIEWWARYGEILYWQLDDEILSKTKNPHWNYDSTETRINEYGEKEEFQKKGSNHFSSPQFPYIFLSVFNLGKQPHDETSLVEQNLTNQDIINRRQRQIDKNAESMNNGLVLSGDHFTKEQAREANNELRRGGTLWIPSGDIGSAYRRDQAPALPSDVFNHLFDTRNELRNIFGIRGSNPEGLRQEKTVRGKIIVQGQDLARIGGGVAEYLEQFYDRVFNWFVQMFYVYYDEEHLATIIGKEKAQEFTSLRNSDIDRKVLVSVKEGSLIPKDPLLERNTAIDLWNAGAISLVELHEKLDSPDPQESARQAYLWQTDPQRVLGEEGQVEEGQVEGQAINIDNQQIQDIINNNAV